MENANDREMWMAVGIIATSVASIFSGLFAFLANQKANSTQLSIVQTQEKVAEVKKIVDGPLSVALKSNADLARKIATLSGSEEDAVAATKAETLDKNRVEGKEN